MQRLPFPGRSRQIDVIFDDPEITDPLISYGDLCWMLPASFRNPIPPARQVLRHRMVFVRASDLRAESVSDRHEPQVKDMLTDLLHTITTQKDRP
ncbi:MAG: hypothetical protein L0K27_02645 [Corynebacterium nuruki]|nr:hypothetical protein [Corynebacterium nuruki]